MTKRKYPNFFIVGAAKAGTTSLYEYIKDHPEIYFSDVKEPTFFPYKNLAKPEFSTDRPVKFVTSEEEYFQLYDGSSGEKAIGEASTPYLYLYNQSINSIKECIPNYRKIKIIIVLRNPTERAFSQYMMKRRDLVENMTFSDAIKSEKKRIADNVHIDFHYIERGRYYDQVQAYQRDFDNVKILFFDDLKTQPKKFVAECLNFLDVDSSFTPNIDEKYNVSGEPKYFFIRKIIMENFPGKRLFQLITPKSLRLNISKALDKKNLVKVKIKVEDKEFLDNIFYEDLRKLRKIIKGDVPSWLDV